MKTTVTRHDFHEAFAKQRPDNFTPDGLNALYDYLTELENDIGEEMELDVIAICCDYTEYESLEPEEIKELERETLVLKIDEGRCIVQDF